MVNIGGTCRDPWSIHTMTNIVDFSFYVLLFTFTILMSFILLFTFSLFTFYMFHFLLFTWISLVLAACGRCETWKWHHRFSIDRLFHYLFSLPPPPNFLLLLFTWILLVLAACGRCETWKWHHRFSIDRLFHYFLFSPQQWWSHLTLEKSRWDCWPAYIIPSMDIRFKEAEIQMWVSYWWSANFLV